MSNETEKITPAILTPEQAARKASAQSQANEIADWVGEYYPEASLIIGLHWPMFDTPRAEDGGVDYEEQVCMMEALAGEVCFNH